MKKGLFVSILFILALMFMPSVASAETYGDLTYTISDNQVTITDCIYNSATEIIIPEKIGEYPVTSIGNNAFAYCSRLKKVTIPEGVTTIGNKAFNECTNITSVSIPNSVTSIGEYAFAYCSYLTDVTIPENITVIEDGTFTSCGRLPSITIPENVTYIGQDAFSYCGTLADVTIPENVTYIEDLAFYNCGSLKNVIIPGGIKTIGYSTFSYCRGLENLVILNGVTSIGSNAFSNCEDLRKVTIPKTVTSIGYAAFNKCYNLSYVYYEGNSNDWSKITISSLNEKLTNANRTLEYVIPKTYTFITNGGSVVDKIEGVISDSPATEKENNEFLGWYDNPEFEGEKVSFPYSGKKTILYAKWKPIVYTTTAIFSETTENTTFKVIPTNVEKGNAIMFASYKSGKLTYFDFAEYEGEPHLFFEVDNKIEYNVVKIFVWQNLGNCIPLSKADVFCEKSENEDDHDLCMEEIDILPTCSAIGKYKDRQCLKCGKIFNGKEIPALEHTEAIDSAVASTCTKTGLTEGKHCSVCSAVIVKQNIIPKAPHKEVADMRIEPTCTSVGYDGGIHCGVCGAILKEPTELPLTECVEEGGFCKVCDKLLNPNLSLEKYICHVGDKTANGETYVISRYEDGYTTYIYYDVEKKSFSFAMTNQIKNAFISTSSIIGFTNYKVGDTKALIVYTMETYGNEVSCGGYIYPKEYSLANDSISSFTCSSSSLTSDMKDTAESGLLLMFMMLSDQLEETGLNTTLVTLGFTKLDTISH